MGLPSSDGVPTTQRLAGPILVVAALAWAGGGLISRAAPIAGPSLAFWRCLLAATVYTGVLTLRGHRPSFATVHASWIGGVGFGLSVVCLFVAYKSTTLLSATVIGSLQPIALGVRTHRTTHRLDGVLWAASAAAAAGAVVVVVGASTQSGAWSLRGDLFAVAGVGAGILYVLGTEHARRERTALEYQAAMLWVAALVVAPIAWVTRTGAILPSADAWLAIAGLVASGGTGHLLFSYAQAHVSVATSSAILLTEVVGVAIGAAVFFDQPIGLVQAFGMAIVAASVAVWLTRRPSMGRTPPSALESTGA